MFTKLSPEVLSYILVLAQESESMPRRVEGADEEYDSDTDSMPRLPFEIATSHISSFIRFTALNTARLWSAIHVDSGAQNADLILERVTAYLTRSRGHLLDVRIELNDGPFPGGDSLNKATEMIAQESHRWRKLTIVTEDDGITDVIANICDRFVGSGEDGLTPALEFLSISVDYSEEGFTYHQRVNGVSERAGIETPSHREHLTRSDTSTSSAFCRVSIKQLPKLSFLRLRGLALYLFQPTLLPRLQTLHLDQTKAIPLSFDFLNRLVATCPMLKHLSIYGDIVMATGHRAHGVGAIHPALTPVLGEQVQPQSHLTGYSRGRVEPGNGVRQALDSIIYLPELHSLRLCGITGSVFRIMLSRLEAPKLQSVSVKGAQKHDLDLLWEDQPTGNGSGHREKPRHVSSPSRFTHMRSLTLNDSDLSQSVYQQLFQAFPRIVEFASYSSMQLHAIPKLLAEGGMGVPWPDLRTLDFGFDIDIYADEKTLEMFMRQRRESGHPIDELRIGVDEVDLEEVPKTDGQTTLIIEKKDGIGTWPSSRWYFDIDDILF